MRRDAVYDGGHDHDQQTRRLADMKKGPADKALLMQSEGCRKIFVPWPGAGRSAAALRNPPDELEAQWLRWERAPEAEALEDYSTVDVLVPDPQGVCWNNAIFHCCMLYDDQ